MKSDSVAKAKIEKIKKQKEDEKGLYKSSSVANASVEERKKKELEFRNKTKI